MNKITSKNNDIENIKLSDLKVSDLFEIQKSDEGILLKVKQHIVLDFDNNHMIVRSHGVGILDFAIIHLNPFYKKRDKCFKTNNPVKIVEESNKLVNKSVPNSKITLLNRIKFFIDNKLKWRKA